jgi:hypothetical protein
MKPRLLRYLVASAIIPVLVTACSSMQAQSPLVPSGQTTTATVDEDLSSMASSASCPVSSSSSGIPYALNCGFAYQNCPVFPYTDQAYNEDISAAPADPHSAYYIKSLTAAAKGIKPGSGSPSAPVQHWLNDFAETVNFADNSTQILNVVNATSTSSASAGADPDMQTQEPWALTFVTEPSSDSDGHSFVFQQDTCRIYELYHTQVAFAGGTPPNVYLLAHTGRAWDLHDKFTPPPGGYPSATCCGLSMFAGAAKYSELENGLIHHALFLIVPYGGTADCQYVWPAGTAEDVPETPNTDGNPFAYYIPYGAKLRLRADYPTAGLSAGAKMAVKALQKYGAIVGDTTSESDPVFKLVYMNDETGSFTTAQENNLNGLQPLPSDFTVVQLNTLKTVGGSCKTIVGKPSGHRPV